MFSNKLSGFDVLFDGASHCLHPCGVSAPGYAAAPHPILPNLMISVCHPFPLNHTERSDRPKRLPRRADHLCLTFLGTRRRQPLQALAGVATGGRELRLRQALGGWLE
ncbi:hypothetical protein EMIT0P253_30208 [Pseudomonas sp. IT-P253]